MDVLSLNDNQKLALAHLNGPMMVLAGPGSGKTTVITRRVHHMIGQHHVNPRDILVITFTKAATEEMRKRFLKLSGSEGERVTFSTFHALFFKILRGAYDYNLDNILKDDERGAIVQSLLMGMNMECGGDFLQNVLNEISLIKNELVDIRYYNSMNLSSEYFTKLYEGYEEAKRRENKIDFDDMLIKCWELLKKDNVYLSRLQKNHKYILIDEFQDINRAQYECVRMLAAPLNNLFVVGDDDQSIYKFRGASPEFLLRFPKDYADTERVVLNINYRSTDAVISLCNKIIRGNKARYAKNIAGTGRSGPAPKLMVSEDISDEAAKIAAMIKRELTKSDPDETAVIYRTNVQARAFADAFMNHNIPFKVKDEMPVIYEHWIAKDIYAYMSLAFDRSSDVHLKRIINKPSRYISKAVLAAAQKRRGGLLNALYTDRTLKSWQLMRIEELMFYLNSISSRNTYDAIKYIRQAVGYDDYLKEYAEYRNMNSKGLYEVLEELQESSKAYALQSEYLMHMDDAVKENKDIKSKKNKPLENGVTLTTMHSAKGLEFETVYIAGAVEGIIPHERSKTDPEIEEERRLLYVGMTRAKNMLYISVIKNRYEQAVKPSRFLNLKQK